MDKEKIQNRIRGYIERMNVVIVDPEYSEISEIIGDLVMAAKTVNMYVTVSDSLTEARERLMSEKPRMSRWAWSITKSIAKVFADIELPPYDK